MRMTDVIHLGCSRLLPVDTANFVQTLKATLDSMHAENINLKQELHRITGIAGLGSQVLKLAKGIRSELTSTQRVKAVLEREFIEFKHNMEDMLRVATKATSNLSLRAQVDMDAITAKYRAEVLQRKLLYNKIQELRGNIRVFLRCRNDPSVPLEIRFPSATEVQLDALTGGEVRCAFLDGKFHSWMPLSFTPLLRLKRCHACDQWHSSRCSLLLPVGTVNCVQTLKGCIHSDPNPNPKHEFRPNTDGAAGFRSGC
jgi:hypothetical protein